MIELKEYFVNSPEEFERVFQEHWKDFLA